MTGSITFTDNAPNRPQTVSLTGVGVQPTVNLSPRSLTFPTQIVFTKSTIQTVVLSNTGLGILSITKIAATGSFTETNNCGSTVNPGSSCTITVTSRPTKAGSITGSLSITDNAPLSPPRVSFKGTGTYVQLTPASLKFGNQPVGTKSIPKKITLSNKGSVAVSITKISVAGADAGDFAQINTCGKSVAPGASCSITVTFTPSARGKRTANLSSFDNGGGSPHIASLTGSGT
jgi:trimeric autotransporter adhesin